VANFCGLSAEESGDIPASFALRSGSVVQLVGSMDCHAFAHRTLNCRNLCPSWVKPGGASTHPPFHSTTPPPTCRTITSAVSAPVRRPPAADYDSQPMPPEPPNSQTCVPSETHLLVRNWLFGSLVLGRCSASMLGSVEQSIYCLPGLTVNGKIEPVCDTSSLPRLALSYRLCTTWNTARPFALRLLSTCANGVG